MKKIIPFCLVALGLCSVKAVACDTPASVCFKATTSSFELVNNNRAVPVVFSSSADSAVQRVAKSFADDLARVSGNKTSIYTSIKQVKNSAVVIGVLGQNELIDELIANNKLSVASIKGQWEAYKIAVVDNPWPNVEQALVIVGSDQRGAIFGSYDLSAKMGVSPWYWFADVATEQKENVFITAGTRHDKPEVKYRGIFINDEDPALKGWANKKFGGVNAGMYERVFELILRLKGNYIWPAMWGKAFNADDPNNTLIADQMGMVMGTSHHEPLALAHKEWHTAGKGKWNYDTNAKNLRKFWRGGMERIMAKGDGQGYENLVTVGMRGDGDEPMSEGTAIELLENIVEDQRKIIADVTEKPANETPQVWTLYKEVQDYYDQGMTVPDDVTLLFADDNWGQIRRLPTKDLDRKGGFGVYYHFDYVGVPRNYKWTNTVQVAKVWQQMSQAYERGARNVWVVNVGDIKPVELPIDFFLSMAWKPSAMTVNKLNNYTKHWASHSFGSELAEDIATLVDQYGNYAAKRKPEMINDTTFAIGESKDGILYKGEFYHLIDKWQQLEQTMLGVKEHITAEQYSSFYQLVEYPIASLSNLYQMYFASAWNKHLAAKNDARANYFYQQVQDTFARDAQLTQQYHRINNGKWDGMMNQVHMNYVGWNTPKQQIIPAVKKVKADKKAGAVVFADPTADPHKLVIEAADYTKAVNGSGLTWTAVPNLGQSTAAMLALPQGKPSTTINDGIRLEYNFEQKESAATKIFFELSPAVDTTNNGGIRFGVSIDDGKVHQVKFNLTPTGSAMRTPGEQAWGHAVITNKQVSDISFKQISKGKHTLKIWRLDDSVILEKIIIDTDSSNDKDVSFEAVIMDVTG